MDEAELDSAMDRYAAGDAAAFAPLHRALYPRLRAFLARMTGSPSLADDLSQETFLRVHRARATFAKGGAVLPWVYAIARNVYLDHARAARRRETERLPSDPGAEPPDRSGGDAESTAIAAEAARVVQRVLAELPPGQREAFILLRYEGLGVNDAAAVLGATPTAVKLRAFRAYEALRAALGTARDARGAATRDSPGGTTGSKTARAGEGARAQAAQAAQAAAQTSQAAQGSPAKGAAVTKPRRTAARAEGGPGDEP